ncbi:2,3-diketo-5-methylthio-1-phosphopentane phosphatase [Pseudomonas fragi]|uniref:2,3-diketo-5-methylthio-1-phosphopentane phosphatase n=1 Tax=Pseudomonas fragi TaxID=296 RepID=A0A449IDG1_PSEFR|nr:2,3-diketo-5-methylthio-1-phosphopentane phosphatase [Pseudomonas fragi]
MPIKAILTDIEGTTSAVSFVFDVLFPYAAKHLPGFVPSMPKTLKWPCSWAQYAWIAASLRPMSSGSSRSSSNGWPKTARPHHSRPCKG